MRKYVSILSQSILHVLRLMFHIEVFLLCVSCRSLHSCSYIPMSVAGVEVTEGKAAVLNITLEAENDENPTTHPIPESPIETSVNSGSTDSSSSTGVNEAADEEKDSTVTVQPQDFAITITTTWSCSCRSSALSIAPSHGCIPSASLCRNVPCGSWRSPTIPVSTSLVLSIMCKDPTSLKVKQLLKWTNPVVPHQVNRSLSILVTCTAMKWLVGNCSSTLSSTFVATMALTLRSPSSSTPHGSTSCLQWTRMDMKCPRRVRPRQLWKTAHYTHFMYYDVLAVKCISLRSTFHFLLIL